MDAFTLRLAVGLLGAIALLCVGGIIWLEAVGQQTPHILATLGAASLGAVAGLLSQRPPDRTERGPLT